MNVDRTDNGLWYASSDSRIKWGEGSLRTPGAREDPSRPGWVAACLVKKKKVMKHIIIEIDLNAKMDENNC